VVGYFILPKLYSIFLIEIKIRRIYAAGAHIHLTNPVERDWLVGLG